MKLGTYKGIKKNKFYFLNILKIENDTVTYNFENWDKKPSYNTTTKSVSYLTKWMKDRNYKFIEKELVLFI